jgi:hypothetical protein
VHLSTLVISMVIKSANTGTATIRIVLVRPVLFTVSSVISKGVPVLLCASTQAVIYPILWLSQYVPVGEHKSLNP